MASAPFWVVATASSAGGLHALTTVLEALPADFPAAVLAVQHLEPGRPSRLPALLQRRCALRVHDAVEGMPVRPGHVYVAMPGRHLALGPDFTILSPPEPPAHSSRPSAEVLFGSLPAACGSRCVAVVLTGRDGDGSVRCADVRRAGGTVIAQDPGTAEYPGMPQSAIDAGCVTRVLPLADIPAALRTLVSG
jgi:two-component system chemotaxis response regulator CheB